MGGFNTFLVVHHLTTIPHMFNLESRGLLLCTPIGLILSHDPGLAGDWFRLKFN